MMKILMSFMYKFLFFIMLFTQVAYAESSKPNECNDIQQEVLAIICQVPSLRNLDSDIEREVSRRIADATLPEALREVIQSDHVSWKAYRNEACSRIYFDISDLSGDKYLFFQGQIKCLNYIMNRQKKFYQRSSLKNISYNGIVFPKQDFHLEIAPLDQQWKNQYRLMLSEYRSIGIFSGNIVNIDGNFSPHASYELEYFLRGYEDYLDNSHENYIIIRRKSEFYYYPFSNEYPPNKNGENNVEAMLYWGHVTYQDKIFGLNPLKIFTADDIFDRETPWSAALLASADWFFRENPGQDACPYSFGDQRAQLEMIEDAERWSFDRNNFLIDYRGAEIKCFDAGPQRAEIPLEDLRAYFTPEFKALIGLD